MDLVRRFSEDQKCAMKAGDRTKTAVLRLLRTRIREAEVEKRGELTDAEVLKIIMSELKRRHEAIELFEKGGRGDLASRETEEIAILETYLPKRLSDEELKAEATKAIEEAQASAPQDLGKVMKILMARIAGRAEGSVATKVVRDLLAEKRD